MNTNAHNAMSADTDNTMVGTMRPWVASRSWPASASCRPSVEVTNVDGNNHDSRRLRDAARALTDAADALDRMRRTTA